VAQLKLGMHVVEAGGRVGVVTGWKSFPGAQTMYNLEVTQDHTYTVGDGQFVVHNCGGSVPPEPKDLTFDKGQVGKKWGKHQFDYPEMENWKEYTERAKQVFNNPDHVSYTPDHYGDGPRFYYTQGKDLLLTHPDGAFNSLFPGASNTEVGAAISIR
jgi:hypothetical protein